MNREVLQLIRDRLDEPEHFAASDPRVPFLLKELFGRYQPELPPFFRRLLDDVLGSLLARTEEAIPEDLEAVLREYSTIYCMEKLRIDDVAEWLTYPEAPGYIDLAIQLLDQPNHEDLFRQAIDLYCQDLGRRAIKLSDEYSFLLQSCDAQSN